MTKSNQNKKMPELMREYDVLIFDKITNEKHNMTKAFLEPMIIKTESEKLIINTFSKKI